MTELTKDLQGIVLVQIDTHIWSGRKMLAADDVNIKEGSVPTDLISLGSKKIIDPSALKDFNNLRKAMERTCLVYGSRFLGGYAIPENNFSEVKKELDEHVEAAKLYKEQLLADYEMLVDEWVKKHPGYESVIRAAVTPSSVVRDRISFNWAAFRVAGMDDSSIGGEMNERLNHAFSTLGETVLDEVAKEAKGLHKRVFKEGSEATQHSVKPLKKLQGKLEEFAFVDAKIKPILDQFRKVMDELPKTGKVTGSQFIALKGLVDLLRSQERVRAYAEERQQDQAAQAVSESSTEESAETSAEESVETSTQDSEAAEPENTQEEDEEQVAEMPPAPAPERQIPSGWVF